MRRRTGPEVGFVVVQDAPVGAVELDVAAVDEHVEAAPDGLARAVTGGEANQAAPCARVGIRGRGASQFLVHRGVGKVHVRGAGGEGPPDNARGARAMGVADVGGSSLMKRGWAFCVVRVG